MASISVTRCSARSHVMATSRAAPDESSPRLTSRSMPSGLLERHGIEPERLAAVTEAFAAGDVQRALEATPDELADRIMVAGTPEDWVRWMTETYAPAGLNHALVSFTDPLTLRAWAGLDIEGLPDLREQVRMFGEPVLPEISSL
jgi:5,10-methylenetetrahydromethanopterin reductase